VAFACGPDCRVKARDSKGSREDLVRRTDEVRKPTGLLIRVRIAGVAWPCSRCLFPHLCKGLHEALDLMVAGLPVANQQLRRFDIAEHRVQCAMDCCETGVFLPTALQCRQLTPRGLSLIAQEHLASVRRMQKMIQQRIFIRDGGLKSLNCLAQVLQLFSERRKLSLKPTITDVPIQGFANAVYKFQPLHCIIEYFCT
jgi:hypothetical protein